jgi:hypothetical protein
MPNNLTTRTNDLLETCAMATPGPWDHMAGMPTNVLGYAGYRVARCDFDGQITLECASNAEAIVALRNEAPDLLREWQARAEFLESALEEVRNTWVLATYEGDLFECGGYRIGNFPHLIDWLEEQRR